MYFLFYAVKENINKDYIIETIIFVCWYYILYILYILGIKIHKWIVKLMITHCPECGALLTKSRNWKFCPIKKNYKCHYEIMYDGFKITYKYRALTIDHNEYYYWSASQHSFTQIANYEFKVIFRIKESTLNIDELEFTKRILRMKAFL